MASTIKLSRTIKIGQQFLRYAPLQFQKNTDGDPALACADWVKQIILSPPFGWRWNRASATINSPTFTTVAGTTDYAVKLPDFGWIEKAVIFDPNSGGAATELLVELAKGQETLANQPARIAAQYDDGAGNITFRVFPNPDDAYPIAVDYQKVAPLSTTDAAETWAPVPDYLSYLYTEGFLAKAYEYAADPRYMTAMQLFLQHLVSAAEGLTETQRNIWLDDKMNTLRQQQALQAGRPV